MDNTTRFDGKGEIYEKARPKYALALFDYLKRRLIVSEKSIFADIGSGTGIFTEQLLNCGFNVFAVEPNADMRKQAEEKLSTYKSFISVDGRADDMKLGDNCVDYITCAQAFHWFDAAEFKKECKRVLKPKGKVIIVYNSRDKHADSSIALADLHRKYNTNFHGFSNGIGLQECVDFFGGMCDIFRADNTIAYSREGFINRVLSSSYSLKETDERYAEFIEDINKIFDKFSKNGLIAIPTETVAYIGSV